MKNPRLKIIDWPASKVEMRRLNKIIPFKNNPRTHPQAQIEHLARLMQTHGVDQPIVIDEDGIILKGHGRRLAALAAGFDRFPVVVHRGLNDEEKTEVRIADNQTGLLAGWDLESLHGEIVGLDAADRDLTILGFSQADIDSFLSEADTPKNDPDDLPEPVKNPTVRQGDIWLLGDHRILCGDATDPENWKRLFNPVERAAVIFTDPPYGVSYFARSGQFEVIKGDDKRRDDLYRMLLASLKMMADHAGEHAAFYIWHASTTRDDFSQAMNAAGLIERQYLIWVKPSIVLGHSDYRWQHEPCFYASKGERKPNFYGGRDQSTVWHIQIGGRQKDVAATIGNGVVILDGEGGTLFVQSKVPKNKKLRQLRITNGKNVFLSGSDRVDGTVWEVTRDSGNIHPTQKPVELARRAIENSSRPGEIVVDGFLGSGTTLIGAEMTGRKCYGIELDPIYAQATIDRWEKFTGKKAIRAEGNNAASNSGIPVRGKNGMGKESKHRLRKSGHDRLPKSKRKPDRQPPVVAGNS